MNVRPEEISRVIQEQIRNYRSQLEQTETGTVILVGDGIARVYGPCVRPASLYGQRAGSL